MRWFGLLSVVALGGLVGCTGGSAEEELSLGESDPNGDFDQDGISNLEEEEMGLDPEAADSDGDECADGRELDAGTDPADPASTLYSDGGNWPCSVEGQLLSPSPNKAKQGKVFKDHGGFDQHGDKFSLWDFHKKEGVKYIVVDVSAEWCPPCNELAGYMDRYNDSFNFPSVRDAVDDGSVVWVTYLDQDAAGDDANKALTARWFDAYPHQSIPVVTDKRRELLDYMEGDGWPTVLILNPSMQVVSKSSNYNVTLGWLEGKLVE